MKDYLLKKLNRSVKVENGEVYVYLSDRRILDKEGNLVGFFDTEKSLLPRVTFPDEPGLVSVEDFKNIQDFRVKIQTFLLDKKLTN